MITDTELERLERLEAALAWVKEVYPANISPGNGARVEMTWDQFNLMREVVGLKPVGGPSTDSNDSRASVNYRLRARAEAAEAENERLRKALEPFARADALEAAPAVPEEWRKALIDAQVSLDPNCETRWCQTYKHLLAAPEAPGQPPSSDFWDRHKSVEDRWYESWHASSDPEPPSSSPAAEPPDLASIRQEGFEAGIEAAAEKLGSMRIGRIGLTEAVQQILALKEGPSS